jgi:hypothetical protein
LPTGQSKPDYVYTMAANRHWSCSGYRLGNAAYTKEAVEAHREEQLKKGPSEADMAQIRANLEVWAEDVLAGCIDKITTLEIRPDVSLKELAKLLRFNDRHQIGGVDDYDRMLKSRAQALKGKKPLSDERRRKLREEYNDIRLTKSLAEKSGLFSNVAYRPSPKLTKAERLATQGEANKAAAKRRKARDNERTPAPVRPRQVGGPALGGDTASAGYTQTPAKTL